MSGDRYSIKNQQTAHFVTFTVVNWIDIFTRMEYKYIIVDSLNYCVMNKGLIIYAWVLMSNHLHLVAQADEKHNLSDIIRDFKKYTAKKIIEEIKSIPESRKEWIIDKFEFEGKKLKRIAKYKFWKDASHAIELSDNKMITEKIDYIHENPVKSLIVSQPEHYLFSSAVDYSGTKGLVEIVKA